jgi:hypothetical protein
MHKLKGAINEIGQAGRIWGRLCIVYPDLADCSTFLRHLNLKCEIQVRRISRYLLKHCAWNGALNLVPDVKGLF